MSNIYGKMFKDHLDESFETSDDKPKISKMGNISLEVDGIRYDSIAEKDRHTSLKLMESSGHIKNLRYHDREDTIILQDDPIIRYEPDFCYELADGTPIIEDVKGFQTDVFILKKKIIINLLRKGKLGDSVFLLVKSSKQFGQSVFTEIERHSKDESIVY